MPRLCSPGTEASEIESGTARRRYFLNHERVTYSLRLARARKLGSRWWLHSRCERCRNASHLTRAVWGLRSSDIKPYGAGRPGLAMAFCDGASLLSLVGSRVLHLAVLPILENILLVLKGPLPCDSLRVTRMDA